MDTNNTNDTERVCIYELRYTLIIGDVATKPNHRENAKILVIEPYLNYFYKSISESRSDKIEI